MRTALSLFVVFGLFLFVAGCSSDQVSAGSSSQAMAKPDFKIVPGQTTEAELRAHFGDPEPNSVIVNDLGTTLVWSDSSRKIMVGSLNPFAGIWGGIQIHTVSATLQNGVVTHYSVHGKNAIEALAVAQ